MANLEVICNLATLTLVQIEEKMANGPVETTNSERPIGLSGGSMPEPNNPPWGAWAAFAVWISSVLFILIIPTLFVFTYLASVEPPITESELIIEFAKSDPTAVLLQIVAVIPAHFLTLLLAWLVVTKGFKYSF